MYIWFTDFSSFSLKLFKLFHDGGPYHIETSPLICKANLSSNLHEIFRINANKYKIKLKCQGYSTNRTAQKMKLSLKDFFSKCDQIRRPADLFTFTAEIFNGKLHFLCGIVKLQSSPHRKEPPTHE